MVGQSPSIATTAPRTSENAPRRYCCVLCPFEHGGDEDDGSTSDRRNSHGSTSHGSQSAHSSGSDSVHSIPEGQAVNTDGEESEKRESVGVKEKNCT